MLVFPGIVTAAKSQGSKELAQSAIPGERFTQVDAVVDLLAESTSPAAQPGARNLLQQMSTVPWRVIRGAHRSLDDPSLHVTIAVAATRYHLRLDGRSCVFDITRVVGDQTQRPAGRKPWVGPGA
jgi:hypothetical protein